MISFSEKDDAVVFNIRVVPRASQSEIVGEVDGILKIKIAAPPVDGAANTELIKVLAKSLDTAKRNIEIINGQYSRNKQVKITNVKLSELSKLFLK